MSEEKNKDRLIMGVVILLVLGFYIGLAFVPFWFAKPDGKLSVNELGDSFGLANAFFSAAAMAGVILTLYFQMKELKLQRKEMIEMQRVQLMPLRLKMLEDYGERNAHNFQLEEYEHWRTESDIIEDFIGLQVNEYLTHNSMLTFEECLSRLSYQSSRIINRIDSLLKNLSEPTIEKRDERDRITDDINARIFRIKLYLTAYSSLSHLSSSERRTLREFKAYIQKLLDTFSGSDFFSKADKTSIVENMRNSLQSIFLNLFTGKHTTDELEKAIKESYSDLAAAFPPSSIQESKTD